MTFESAASEPYPAPRSPSFDNGLMVFEQLVSEELERDSAIAPTDLHIYLGRQWAANHGYHFTGEGKVERLPASDGWWLYRMTVPVAHD